MRISLSLSHIACVRIPYLRFSYMVFRVLRASWVVVCESVGEDVLSLWMPCLLLALRRKVVAVEFIVAKHLCVRKMYMLWGLVRRFRTGTNWYAVVCYAVYATGFKNVCAAVCQSGCVRIWCVYYIKWINCNSPLTIRLSAMFMYVSVCVCVSAGILNIQKRKRPWCQGTNHLVNSVLGHTTNNGYRWRTFRPFSVYCIIRKYFLCSVKNSIFVNGPIWSQQPIRKFF